MRTAARVWTDQKKRCSEIRREKLLTCLSTGNSVELEAGDYVPLTEEYL